MKLRLIIPGLAAAAAIVFAGCSKRGTAVEIGNQEQVIHIGNLGEPNDLDPQIADTQQTANICMALFEGLTQYDAKTSQPVPAVAERWESNADATQWTFHLRANAKWSNGDPVTAHDFVFAFRRILAPNLAAEYASLHYALKNGQAYNGGQIKDPTQIGVHATDDRTLVLDLEHPVPYMPTMVSHAAFYPLPKATIEKYGPVDSRGNPWTRPGNMVSNGYFVLKEWKPHQYVHGTKSPTYWDRDNVKLNGFYFYPIESEDAEERTFRSGQLHVTSTLPISKIAVYEKEKSPAYHPHVFLATFFLRFNTDKPPLNDPRVRRALSLSIDRETFVRDVMHGHQIPAGSLTPPDTAGFTAKVDVKYDVPAAQKLLAEAGFPQGKGFPRLEILYNNTEANRLISEALQQMWRKALGVDIGLVNQEGKVWADSMRARNYQIARMAWIGDYMDPSTFIELMTGDGTNNMTGWRNPEYDKLYTEANQTVDTARRYQLYQRCEEILAAEAPIAPIYFYTRNNLVRPEVKGWYGNLLDYHPLKGVYLEKPGT